MTKERSEQQPKPGEEMTRMTLYLPKSLHKRLKIKAATDDKTMNEMILVALEKQYDLTLKGSAND